MEALLELENIHCGYDGHTVVDGLSLHITRGQLTCLLGQSGCGKTTVLRAIAGFEPVRGGEIRLHGEVISSPSGELPPEKRGLGMVFQDYALFPHLNVADNIAFGLRGLERKQREHQTDKLLALVGMEGHGKRFPH